MIVWSFYRKRFIFLMLNHLLREDSFVAMCRCQESQVFWSWFWYEGFVVLLGGRSERPNYLIGLGEGGLGVTCHAWY